MTEQALFDHLLKTPEGERAVLLHRACAGNVELRQRVEQLLRAHEDSKELPAANQTAIDVTTGFQATQSYTSPEPTPGVVIAGRYMLEQKLGEGGMGEVWVAKQSEPVKRKVALKLIKAGMDSKSVIQRFEQERQALAMMDHPNIAKVLVGGLTEVRRPFFVMKLVNSSMACLLFFLIPNLPSYILSPSLLIATSQSKYFFGGTVMKRFTYAIAAFSALVFAIHASATEQWLVLFDSNNNPTFISLSPISSSNETTGQSSTLFIVNNVYILGSDSSYVQIYHGGDHAGENPLFENGHELPPQQPFPTYLLPFFYELSGYWFWIR